MIDFRQNMLGEQVALVHMAESREDECFDTYRLVGTKLCDHLVRVTNYCCPRSAPGAPDAGPSVLFGVSVVVGTGSKSIQP